MQVTLGPPGAARETADEDVIARAFREDGVDLLRFFQRRVDDREDAADLLGDLLILALRKRATLPLDATDRRMYLFGMAKNVLRNHRRGRARRNAATEALVRFMETHTASEFDAGSADVRHDIVAALRRLPTRQRDVVTLIHWEGFSQTEVAQILKIPASTVRSSYRRARAALAIDLGVKDQ